MKRTESVRPFILIYLCDREEKEGAYVDMDVASYKNLNSLCITYSVLDHDKEYHSGNKQSFRFHLKSSRLVL